MPSREPAGLSFVERLYLGARVLLSASLLLLYATGVLVLPNRPGIALMFQVAAGVFALATAASVTAVLLGMSTRLLLWSVLPLDLVVGSMLVVTLSGYQDPVYTWMLGMSIFYAIVMTPRESDTVATLVALAYLTGHFSILHGVSTLGAGVVVLLKAGSAVVFVVLLARLMSARMERERELVASRDSIEDLNEQLQRRLAELNAVSEITEVVHSSLDFDAIGPRLLGIVRKVVDVSACSLLVVDKARSETLFSASTHDTDTPRDMAAISPEDATFACITLLDHPRISVVFCAPGEEIDRMRTENRMMLQAVASELAVAVENSQLYQLTKRLAITDELTGLNNYRFLQERLEDEFERASRYGRALSLLMIDADEFKHFNDTHGHIAGDAALADLGTVLKSSIREIDIPARYGGEEFAVILPETDAAGAFVVAEKIREAVSAHSFAAGSGERTAHLSVSVGLASYPAHAGDRETLLRQADEALYQAKALGRDRVRSATASVHPVEDRSPDTHLPGEVRLSGADVEEQPA